MGSEFLGEHFCEKQNVGTKVNFVDENKNVLTYRIVKLYERLNNIIKFQISQIKEVV